MLESFSFWTLDGNNFYEVCNDELFVHTIEKEQDEHDEDSHHWLLEKE